MLMISSNEELRKKKNNFICLFFWIGIFAPLLFVNLLTVGLLLYLYILTPSDSSDIVSSLMFRVMVIGFIFHAPYFLSLGVVDFIAILFFILKQNPRGTAKLISYAALIFPAFHICFIVYLKLRGC
jgi:hypothetical protein